MLENKKKEVIKESMGLSERVFGLNVEIYVVLLSLYDLRTDRVVAVCRPFLLYSYQDVEQEARNWAVKMGYLFYACQILKSKTVHLNFKEEYRKLVDSLVVME